MHYPTDRIAHQSWSTGWNEKWLNGSTPWRINQTTHCTMSERSYHLATFRSHSVKEETWCHHFTSYFILLENMLQLIRVACFGLLHQSWSTGCLRGDHQCRCTHRERVLADPAAGDAEQVGGVEPLQHGLGLAGVHHEEQLVVAPLLPHLLEGVGQLDARHLLRVLELEEPVPTVTWTTQQII